MNSRTPASALRATMRIHASTNSISPALVHLTGCRSVQQSAGAPRRQLPLALSLGSSVQRRCASQAAAEKYEPPEQHQQQLPSENHPNLSPQDANPPASTRPPPIVLPVRKPDTSTFQHYFAIGKVYLTFYKTGVKNIYHNTRLIYPSRTADKSLIPRPDTRSHLLLRDRWAHDIRRLPLFVLLLIVCGEFTPLVVVAIPSIVPYTCRLPQHVDKLRKKMQERRAHSLTNHHCAALSTPPGPQPPLPVAHLARSLGIVSSFWDKIGFVPGLLARPRLEKRLRFLVQDSALLLKAGGVDALEDEEVKLACSDRGIDVLDRSDEELRGVLSRWLRLVMSHRGGQDESVERTVFLLTRPETDWPREI
ncbi:hypothetical protein V8F06_002630 [Rhypophila decipiens]